MLLTIETHPIAWAAHLVLTSAPCHPQTCSGVQLHVVEVYLPELIAMATGCVSYGCCGASLGLGSTHTYMYISAANIRTIDILSEIYVGNKSM